MTPLEKAAKAAGDAITKSTKGLSLHPETCVAAVRAALAALMEPTDEMLVAGAVAEGDGNLAVEARNIWQAMLKKVIDP